MPPLPPTSTLFPYTTLFRSARACAQRRTHHRARGCDVVADGASIHSSDTHAGRYGRHVDRQLLRDRKSTRLNSSHSSISYAVFCLKKKNKTKADNHVATRPT